MERHRGGFIATHFELDGATEIHPPLDGVLPIEMPLIGDVGEGKSLFALQQRRLPEAVSYIRHPLIAGKGLLAAAQNPGVSAGVFSTAFRKIPLFSVYMDVGN